MLPIGDDQDHEITPVVTYVLLVANAVAFLVFCLPTPRPDVLEEAAFVPANFRPHTLLTHLFLHANLFHLLGNMLFLWIFGRLTEERLGHLGFALFYLVCGLGAAILHAVTTSEPHVPALGSSGAVSGTIGACLVFCPRANVRMLFWFWIVANTVLIPVTLWAALWFIEQVYFASAGFGGVAYYAHIGGFAAGFGISWIIRFVSSALRRSRPPPLEPKDSASLAEPRRVFAPAEGDADPAFLDDSIDAYAVVTMDDGRPRSDRGVVARRLPREAADRLRRDLEAQGVAAALIADQAPNYPPPPQAVDAASWDDRLLRIRLGNQIVPVPWSSPFLVMAAQVGEETFIDVFLSRKAAYRIRNATGVALTRVDVRRRSEEAVDLAGLAADFERRRDPAGTDGSVRDLAAGGDAARFTYTAAADYDDYVFRTYHLARSGKPIRST